MMLRAVVFPSHAEAASPLCVRRGHACDARSRWFPRLRVVSFLPTFATHVGTTSVMLARAAQWNPSAFRSEGMLPPVEAMRDYLKIVCCASALLHFRG